MKSSLLIAFLREKMAFVVDLSRPKAVVAVFNTPVFFVCFSFVTCFYLICVCCFFSVHHPTAAVVRVEPKENLQLFYYFIATCRRLSSRVTKKMKECVNRNRFEICVKLLNTKVTEKSRSIFILYIVIIRKSVRLVLQEKKTRVWLKRNENTERRKPRHRRIS